MTDHLGKRIKSFVIRAGRMTECQQKCRTTGCPLLGCELDDKNFYRDNSFDVAGRRVLEIGFGMGDSLVAMAQQNLGDRYLGIEVHTPGVGKLLSEVDKRGITNLKVFAEDAVQVLEDAIPPHSIDLLQIFFPDPWHKSAITSGD